MRVTYTMLTNTLLNDLSNNLNRVETLQKQLSSGKKISSPSDDPVGATRAISLRSTLNGQDQYIRNMDFAKAELDMADKTLQEISDVLRRVKDLSVRGANESLPQDSRDAIGKEVDQLIDQLIQLGNTTVSGRHIFSGFKTTTSPLERIGDVVNYRGDDNTREVEIASRETLKLTPTGKNLFVDTGMFDNLIELKNALFNGDTSGVNRKIGVIDSMIDKVNMEISEVGARSQRLDWTNNLLQDREVTYKDLLSKQEDIDIEDVVLKLYAQQNVYQASLMAAAKVLQPSLINYLS
ncbi:MAG: flagellar hook-associated protein FlgL [bacterium]